MTVGCRQRLGGAIQRVASAPTTWALPIWPRSWSSTPTTLKSSDKPVAAMMVHNNTPVRSCSRRGHRQAGGPDGQEAGSAGLDAAGRRGFRFSAKANKVGEWQWTTMDPAAARETMLVRGDIDAITGFTPLPLLLNLEARGAKAAGTWRSCRLPTRRELYGNVIIASPAGDQRKPRSHFRNSWPPLPGRKDVMAKPAPPSSPKARDGIVNTALETRRLAAGDRHRGQHPDARKEGFGQVSPTRMALMASQMSDAYATKTASIRRRCGTAAFCRRRLDVCPQALSLLID